MAVGSAYRAAFSRVPFRVGESFEFKMQAEWVLVRGNGTASLSVDALETLRGHPVYRLSFRKKGGGLRSASLRSRWS